MWLCKSYSKEKKQKESIEKNGKVSELSKQWVLRCPPEKKRERWIRYPMFSCKYFQVSKERYVFQGA